MNRTWRPTENYLVQFTAEQLSDQELYKIWEAYDVNGDDKMDRDELSFLMEDLCEVQDNIAALFLIGRVYCPPHLPIHDPTPPPPISFF